MSVPIERLECRTLLSASPDQFVTDLQQTVSDGNSIIDDPSSCRAQIMADVKATNADLRLLAHTSANRRLLSALRASENQWLATFLRDYRSVVRAGFASGQRAVKDGNILVNNPTDPATARRLLSELKTLQQRTAAPLATFLADMPKATAALTGRLAAIVAADQSNSALQSHVTSETTDANTCLATFQTDAKTAQADVAMLIADLTP